MAKVQNVIRWLSYKMLYKFGFISNNAVQYIYSCNMNNYKLTLGFCYHDIQERMHS